MKILIWGLGIFCLALSIHLIIWKIRIPKRQIKSLLQIFFGILAVCIVLLWTVSSFIVAFDNFAPKSLPEYLHIILFFVSLALAYITTYSVIEVDSPTLTMIHAIGSRHAEGVSEEALKQLMTDDILIKPRIGDLVRDGFVYINEEDRYRLTEKGTLLVSIFILYRRLLRASKGG